MGASEDGADALADLKGRLRNLRARRRLSMITLSRRAGLGRTTVSQALNGTGVPSDATVAALAAALGADPEELLRLRDRAVPPHAGEPVHLEPVQRRRRNAPGGATPPAESPHAANRIRTGPARAASAVTADPEPDAERS
ncbi:helix-turn-helix domain-containing protein [Streptomyces sp. NPDC047071]|uniref:helix-turn-helix domain-containing protein n=1 Tax=Streptomyces sp. NPDC047071 TaxID=3154808 RepID=UPI00345167BB